MLPRQAQAGWALAGEGDLQDPGHPAGIGDLLDLGLDLAAGAAGLAAGQPGGQARQLPVGLGQGLVEAAGLAGVEGGRVGEDHLVGRAERGSGGFGRGQPAESVRVHQLVAARGDGQQIRVLGGRQRGDVAQPEPGQVVLVGGRVVAGVEGHGQFPRAAAETLVAGDQLVDDRGELGDVGPVARVGAGDHRDTAIAGDHQAPGRPAAGHGVSAWPCPLGDRRPSFAESMKVAKLVMSSTSPDRSSPTASSPPDPALDLGQLRHGEHVHGVPEPAVIQRAAGILTHRSAAVVAHQSANASFEHGATTRFSVASAR